MEVTGQKCQKVQRPQDGEQGGLGLEQRDEKGQQQRDRGQTEEAGDKVCWDMQFSGHALASLMNQQDSHQNTPRQTIPSWVLILKERHAMIRQKLGCML